MEHFAVCEHTIFPWAQKSSVIAMPQLCHWLHLFYVEFSGLKKVRPPTIPPPAHAAENFERISERIAAIARTNIGFARMVLFAEFMPEHYNEVERFARRAQLVMFFVRTMRSFVVLEQHTLI